MEHVYIDFSGGDDSTGDGTVGSPWKTIDHAIATPGDWPSGPNATSGGNQINIRDNATHVPTVAAPTGGWASTWGGTVTQSYDNPLIFRGYTTAADDGGIAVIDGEDGVSSWINAAQAATHLIYRDLSIKRFTGTGVPLSQYSTAYHCIVDDVGSPAIDTSSSYTRIEWCHIKGGSSGNIAIDAAFGARIAWNFIEDWPAGTNGAIYISGANVTTIYENIVQLSGGTNPRGIFINGDMGYLYNNTVVDKDDAANGYGIYLGSGADYVAEWNNLVTDFGGTSAAGIKAQNTSVSMHRQGPDHIQGCTVARETIPTRLWINNTGDDETGDPSYTDAASDDYSVGSGVKDQAWPAIVYGSSTDMGGEMGAAPREEPAAGGTDQESLHHIEEGISL